MKLDLHVIPQLEKYCCVNTHPHRRGLTVPEAKRTVRFPSECGSGLPLLEGGSLSRRQSYWCCWSQLAAAPPVRPRANREAWHMQPPDTLDTSMASPGPPRNARRLLPALPRAEHGGEWRTREGGGVTHKPMDEKVVLSGEKTSNIFGLYYAIWAYLLGCHRLGQFADQSQSRQLCCGSPLRVSPVFFGATYEFYFGLEQQRR